MTRGGFFNFEFSTPDGGLRTIRKAELEEYNKILKILCIRFRRDPKGITYVAFFFLIKSHAKMRWSIEASIE